MPWNLERKPSLGLREPGAHAAHRVPRAKVLSAEYPGRAALVRAVTAEQREQQNKQ